MSLHLYDTKTQQIRAFEPLRPGHVSIYHCGLTVYGSPHLGHLRKEVVFDVLRRWLTHEGFEVAIVANITDIDDKILRTAAAAGTDWYAHAYRYERELHDAYRALGCLPPTYEPRATGHIPEMLELIGELIDRGHAYPADDASGDVWFDVRSWERYGELSHQKIGDMQDADDTPTRGKRDPRDFALWKGHKTDEPVTASWPSPWGRGRPGWHLECSAMAGKYLGAEFDIHGGGIDLRFPHHENELAQSAAAGREFARYWMHNAFVTASKEKMSKSLGNGASVAEVTQRHPARAVRLFLAGPHYRSSIELSEDLLTEASTALARIDGFCERAAHLGDEAAAVPTAFVTAMNDDLGTPQALAVIHQRVREGNQALDAGDDTTAARARAEVIAMLGVLGLDPAAPEWNVPGTAATAADTDDAVGPLVETLLDQRRAARERKDYAAADAIRDSLTDAGITVEDTPAGPRWTR